MNKSLITYSIISFILIFFFGFNFIFSLLGNILILLFLTPILLIIIAFFVINSYKSKFKVCTSCGTAIMTDGDNCQYCGTKFSETENNKKIYEDAASETIEIEAEEIK
tara:strand:+ start:114 stop:437 length:324 start_codon:yes stop_codon:yes gene_type:complete